MKQAKTMKNIHVLPTEKPSRVVISKDKKKCYLYSIEEFKDIENFREYDSKNWDSQHIYITSDEEIKEGYAFHLKTQEVLKLKGVGEKSKEIFHSKGFSYPEECKKIILTTDQDLIKDGVQAIDDEFFEWFVKNPSCEMVEVVLDDLCFISSNYEKNYKIIIPKEIGFKVENGKRTETFYSKEEPTLEEEYLKDELKKYDGIGVVVLNKPEEPKQETLEEVAEKYAKDFGCIINYDIYYSFIAGAKWQQEQDKNKFSEEDMKKSYHCGRLYQGREGDTTFEQFIRTI